jgi:hypothetical protein
MIQDRPTFVPPSKEKNKSHNSKIFKYLKTLIFYQTRHAFYFFKYFFKVFNSGFKEKHPKKIKSIFSIFILCLNNEKREKKKNFYLMTRSFISDRTIIISDKNCV